MEESKWKPVVALVLVLGVALLMVLLKDFVQQSIVEPVMYLFWLIGLFYHSVAQSLWWFLIVVVAFILLSGALIWPKQRPVETRQRGITANEGHRISYWLAHTYLAIGGEEQHKFLNQALMTLVKDVIAYRERLPVNEVWSALRSSLASSRRPVPPIILSTFQNATSPVLHKPGRSLFKKIGLRILAWLRRQPYQDEMKMDPDFIGVLDYLEDQLETQNAQ